MTLWFILTIMTSVAAILLSAPFIRRFGRRGSLALVFWTLTCPRSCLGLLIRRSPPRLLAEAARTGLRPAPERRSRGAHPHLLRSCTARLSS